MNGVLIFAFIGGAVATVNPCGFALLPAYLARRINTENDNGSLAVILRAIAVGAMTSAGFMIIFGTVGIAISLGAFWIMAYMPWAGLGIGILLALAGILVMGGQKIALRLPVLGGHIHARSLRGDLLFGIGYGTVSLSCTLPIFLAVTGTAITGGLTGSILTFVAYASGMGTVLMVLAISAGLARRGLATLGKKAGIHAQRFSGGVMVLSGIYVTFYWGIILFLPDVPAATALFTYGDRIASPIRKWIGGQAGTLTMTSLAILIVVVLAWALWVRFMKKSKVLKPGKTTHPI